VAVGRAWRPGQRPTDHDDVLELVTIDGDRAIGTVKSSSIVVKGRVYAEGQLVAIGTADDMALLRQFAGKLVAVMPVHEYTDEPPEDDAEAADGRAAIRYD
jgi:hypothetical protein